MEWLLSRDRNINNNKKSLLSKQEYEKKIDILARYCSDYRSGIFPQRIELHDEIDVFNDLIKKYFELIEVLKEYEINEVYQTMKINYDEFNELQTQQKIRDYSQDVYNTLICLEQIVKRKDKKQIRDMMSCIHYIENEAVENISKMIEGD